jgi:hypothetical protein
MSDENKALEVIVKESGLEPAKAQVLLDNFSDYFQLAAAWEQKAKVLVVTDVSQVAEMKMAREGRLFLREKRIAIETTRKKMKEQSLREGKAIDGIANVLKALIVPIEEYLDEQEHFAEYKQKAEEEARRLEAEKLLREKEERDRLAKEAEDRRIREENDRLKKEAEAREAAASKEREKAERKLVAERKAAEAKLQAEREAKEKELAEERRKAETARKAAEAKARAEADKIRKEAEAKIKAEREAHERRLAEERRKAAMITCPKCGHTWNREDVK